MRSRQERDRGLEVLRLVREEANHRLVPSDGRERVEHLAHSLHERHVRVLAEVRLVANHARERSDPALQVRVQQARLLLVPLDDDSDAMEVRAIARAARLDDARDYRVHLVSLRDVRQLLLVVGELELGHRLSGSLHRRDGRRGRKARGARSDDGVVAFGLALVGFKMLTRSN